MQFTILYTTCCALDLESSWIELYSVNAILFL